ncbi:MAG: invasion associated locus B family protein [Hyphomicrobiaceae bacterium]|nr:invasion associated locus B family protein [Hyphomicrobiaceae bacterium]
MKWSRLAGVAAMVLIGEALLLNEVSPSPASAQAKKADATQGKVPEDTWVKLCDKRQAKAKDKDGKEVTKNVNECITLTERIHPHSGITLMQAKYHELKIDSEERKAFEVTVPLGAVLPYGAAITLLPNDIWQKVEKNEKLEKAEEEKLKSSQWKLTYSICGPAGCIAEMEANADFISKLKSSAGFVLESVQAPMGPIGHKVSLKTFSSALANAPTDTKKFADAKNEMMKGIYEHRQQLLAEYKKKQEELQKMQPNVGPKK